MISSDLEIEPELFYVTASLPKQLNEYVKPMIHSPIVKWMRKRVSEHLLSVLKPGSKILELSSGDGLDQEYFLVKGFSIHPTDESQSCSEKLSFRTEKEMLENQLKTEELSYSKLPYLPSQSYDHIFSTFGGLNRVPDLKAVIDQFGRILKKDGLVTIVVMPKISPWELFSIFKLNTKVAFRRFRKNGDITNLENLAFKTWYINPKELINQFDNNFKVVKWQGLATMVPPPRPTNFFEKYPVFLRLLSNIDEKLSHKPVFRSCADHFILSMQLKPQISNP